MGNQQATCCICLEKKTRGVPCSNKHLTCKECFPQYVKSCYENGAKFCDQGFVIRCPDPGCMSNPLTISELKANLPETVMDSYVESLIRYNNRMKSGAEIPKESVKQQLVDALNLKCPSCRNVLDQNPDGCCAMRCLNCGIHFCWLCFQICAGPIVCHTHVGSCRLNPTKNLFAPASDVQAAHKLRRIRQIHAVLKFAHDPAQHGTLSWKETTQTRTLLNDCLSPLKMNQLTPSAVLSTPEVEDRPAPPPPPPNEVLQWFRQNNNGALVAGGLILFYILTKLLSPSSTTVLVSSGPLPFHKIIPYHTAYTDALEEDVTKVLSISLCPKNPRDTDERYIDFTKYSTSRKSGSSLVHNEPTSGASESTQASKAVYELITSPDKSRNDKGKGSIQPYLCVAKDGLHVYYNSTVSTLNNGKPVTHSTADQDTDSMTSFVWELFNKFTYNVVFLSALIALAAYTDTPHIMAPPERRRAFHVSSVVGCTLIVLQVVLRVLWFVWEYAGTLFLIIAMGGGIYANMQHDRRH